MSRFRAVVFDLDGTLVDSLTDIALSMNAALEHFKLPSHPVENYQDFVGEGVRTLAERASHSLSSTQIDELISFYRAVYKKNMTQHTKPFDGVPQLLTSLRDAGVKIGVLSNKRNDFTNELTRLLFDENLFDAIVGETTEALRKPNPHTLLEMLSKFKIAPPECAFVGDTQVDMQTAFNAKAYAVGVSWGFRPNEVRDSKQTSVYCDSLNALSRVLLG